jgi:hypothetical protein
MQFPEWSLECGGANLGTDPDLVNSYAPLFSRSYRVASVSSLFQNCKRCAHASDMP